jgi:hypothetical protein
MKIGLIVTLICLLAISGIVMLDVAENVALADDPPFEITAGMYDSYTDSDYFEYNGSTYSIFDYAASISSSSSTLHHSTVSFPGGYLVPSDDDPITRIVPRELFINRGDWLYVGKEYGFFVNTRQFIIGGSF